MAIFVLDIFYFFLFSSFAFSLMSSSASSSSFTLVLPEHQPQPAVVRVCGVSIQTDTLKVNIRHVLQVACATYPYSLRLAQRRWAKRAQPDPWVAMEEVEGLLQELVPAGRGGVYRKEVELFMQRAWPAVSKSPERWNEAKLEVDLERHQLQTIQERVQALEISLQAYQHGSGHAEFRQQIFDTLSRLTFASTPRHSPFWLGLMLNQPNRSYQDHLPQMFEILWKQFILVTFEDVLGEDIATCISSFFPTPPYSPNSLRSLMANLDATLTGNEVFTATGRHIHVNPSQTYQPYTFEPPTLSVSADLDSHSLRVDDITHPEFWLEIQLPQGLRLVRDTPKKKSLGKRD